MYHYKNKGQKKQCIKKYIQYIYKMYFEYFVYRKTM